jgi:Nucleotidyl transferase AbiEii toxin, Type IV TA system
MFERSHHQLIARVLSALDGNLLRETHCYFGGGTAIALRCGEFRESVDIDFLVSELSSYRRLRQLLTGPAGLSALIGTAETQLFAQKPAFRADQYGIRTVLQMGDQRIKFEIVLEGRIQLEKPALDDQICGVSMLTPLDLATSKLLANSDRWADDGAFSRDLIDLAMMKVPLRLLRQAVAKAEGAYGQSICRDLGKAIDRVQNRHGWLEHCMKVMSITLPKAVVWERIRSLKRVLP